MAKEFIAASIKTAFLSKDDIYWENMKILQSLIISAYKPLYYLLSLYNDSNNIIGGLMFTFHYLLVIILQRRSFPFPVPMHSEPEYKRL